MPLCIDLIFHSDGLGDIVLGSESLRLIGRVSHRFMDITVCQGFNLVASIPLF